LFDRQRGSRPWAADSFEPEQALVKSESAVQAGDPQMHPARVCALWQMRCTHAIHYPPNVAAVKRAELPAKNGR